MTWKNSMHVVQTSALPPYNGSSNFPIMGSMENSSPALAKLVAVKTMASQGRGRWAKESLRGDTSAT